MRARRPRRPVVLVALPLALVALLAAGCRGGDGGGDDDGAGAQPAPTTDQADATPAGAGAASTTTTRAPARVIATAEGEFPGLLLELLSLRRTSGEIVTLEFAMRNSGPAPLDFRHDAFSEPGLGNADFDTVGGVYLTDEVNRKKYLVQRDSEGSCLCSRDIETPDKPGTRAVYFAKFPAPPPTVRTVTVVVPHFTPVDGVGISE